MTFLPIVDRELRVGSRRHATYTVRQAIALLAIILGVFLYLANARAPAATAAGRIFMGLSILALVYCLAAGRRSTADCLSEEKREGTLGLLFLTDLKGYDVILGKLAATSLSGFYGLLAIFPVLAIPLLIGGITNGEFWRMVFVLVNTFLFSLSIGLVASVLSKDARKAYGVNFLLLLLLGGIPAAAAGAIAYYTPSNLVVHELLFSCPVYSFYLSFDLNYRWQTAHFWSSVGVIHALTWMLVATASRIAPRSWQDHPAGLVRISRRERWRDWIYGNGTQRKAFRRRLLNINAFYWLASRVRLKPLGVWLLLSFVACWWLFVVFQLKFHWSEELVFFATTILLNSILKLWMAVEVTQRLAEDQKVGALELLLSTPLSVGEILRGQLLALRRQFLFPLLAVIGIEWILIRAIARYSPLVSSTIRDFGFACILMLVLDVAALMWVGMSAGLTAKNPNQAAIRTFWRVLILPWVVFVAIAVLVNIVAASSSSAPPEWRFFLYLWVWLGIFADLGFGLPALWQVSTRFRELALRRLTKVQAEAGQ
jgi:hypothetical protein